MDCFCNLALMIDLPNRGDDKFILAVILSTDCADNLSIKLS